MMMIDQSTQKGLEFVCYNDGIEESRKIFMVLIVPFNGIDATKMVKFRISQ